MIVAITGATGFIGKKLVTKHLALGDEVRFLTRNPRSLNSFASARGYLGDLSVPSPAVNQFVDGVDVLYHLAAELSDEEQMWQANVVGTKNLLEAADGKVNRWIQLSSTGVYGKRREGVVTEDSVLSPNNPYEKSKAEADRLVKGFWQGKNIPVYLLRPSNVYGPEMPNQALFQLIRVINKGLFFFVGNEGAVVNYIHVDNVVDALILCSKADISEQSSTYIVSDYCSIEKMIAVIASSLGKPTPRLRLPKYVVEMLAVICEKIPSIPLKQSRVDAITGTVIYSSKHLHETLGYSNMVSIEDGLKELVASWKASIGD